MATKRGTFNLFGMDLAAVANDWRQGWGEAMQWPLFARLCPAEPVCLVGPAGDIHAGAAGVANADPRTAGHLAVLLPDQLVLRRSLDLPPLSGEAQRQALELELQAVNPFPADGVAWGYVVRMVEAGVRADLAFASRGHIEAHIGSLHAVIGDRLPEVWACAEPPIVLSGFGETPRRTRQRRSRLKLGGLVAALLLLALLLFASPVLQKRARVIDAEERLATLNRDAAPVVAQRDALGRLSAQAGIVGEHARGRADPRQVLARLTELLPDTAYLTRFELRGDAVTAGGLAANAAAVLDMLGSQPDFQDLRAPGAIMRDAASGRETFLVEFRLAAGEGQ
jgi:general secretion pathway protein L